MRLALIGTGMMGERRGRRLLDAGHELAACNRTTGRTKALAAGGAAVAATPREAAGQAAVVLSDKDLRLMEATAAGAGGDLPLLEAVRGLYAAALAAGRGDLDFSAVKTAETPSD
jgi:3-hydroxyisobutyrate dehydrogenase-like beta-hydroxyacid dehydrogenase